MLIRVTRKRQFSLFVQRVGDKEKSFKILALVLFLIFLLFCQSSARFSCYGARSFHLLDVLSTHQISEELDKVVDKLEMGKVR